MLKIKAEHIVRGISGHLNKTEVEILEGAVEKVEKMRQQSFPKHLDEVSELVDDWPSWKRKILG